MLPTKTYTHVYTLVYTQALSTCLHTCVCACLCVVIGSFIHMSAYMSLHTSIRTFAHVCTHMHKHAEAKRTGLMFLLGRMLSKQKPEEQDIGSFVVRVACMHWARLCGHGYRRVYRQAYRHVYRHAHRFPLAMRRPPSECSRRRGQKEDRQVSTRAGHAARRC